MSIRDVYLIACTAIISSLLTWLAFETSADNPTAVTQDISENRNFSTQAQLSDECRKVQYMVNVENKQITPSKPTRVKTPADTVAANARELAAKAELDAALETRFSRIIESREDNDSGDLGAQIENRYYEEEWDPDWAEDKESKIQKLFNQNKKLENVLPLDISCRSQNCQIVLPATNEKQIHELSTTFMQVAANSDLGMARQSVSFFTDPVSSSLVFYISENQHENLITQ